MRSSEYLEYPVAGSDNPEEGSLNIFGITETISPEQLVTEQLVGLLNYTSSLQVLSFANDKVRMVIVQARKGGLLIGREIADINQHLLEGVDCQICAIYRNNRLIVPTPQTVIMKAMKSCLPPTSTAWKPSCANCVRKKRAPGAS